MLLCTFAFRHFGQHLDNSIQNHWDIFILSKWQTSICIKSCIGDHYIAQSVCECMNVVDANVLCLTWHVIVQHNILLMGPWDKSRLCCTIHWNTIKWINQTLLFNIQCNAMTNGIYGGAVLYWWVFSTKTTPALLPMTFYWFICLANTWLSSSTLPGAGIGLGGNGYIVSLLVDPNVMLHVLVNVDAYLRIVLSTLSLLLVLPDLASSTRWIPAP